MTARVAIVTGGASGIGLALGRALTRRGDTVVLADVDGAAADQAAADLVATGATASAYAVDVRDAGEVQALVTSTVERYGRLDLMINNAGVVVQGGCEDLTLEQWDRAIDINLRGVIHGVKAAYPVMLEQGHGCIANMASLAGLVPAPMAAPYGATKHGVIGLTLALRAEAATHGIGVSAICPGFINTPLTDRVDESTKRFFYSADQLADDVLRGLDRNRGMIVAPRSARITWRLERLSPRIGDAIAVRFTERVHRGGPGVLDVVKGWRRRLNPFAR